MHHAHALAVRYARRERRSKHIPFNNLIQVPEHPVLSLVRNHFGIEIGSSPTYEFLPCDMSSDRSRSDGAKREATRRQR